MHFIRSIIFVLFLQRTMTIRCYICEDCGDSEGILETCPNSQNADSCIYSRSFANGKVTKSCGDQSATAGLSIGCIAVGYFRLCRCATDACNRNNINGTNDRSSFTTVKTTMSLYAQQRPQGNFAGESRVGPPKKLGSMVEGAVLRDGQLETLRRDPWYCYQCTDCRSNVGVLVNCAAQNELKSCIFIEGPDGVVNRTCGSTGLTQLGEVGCHSLSGYNYCMCQEQECNRDPLSTLTTSLTTTLPSTTSTAASNQLWSCHSCYDCRESVGTLVNCSREQHVQTCYLLIYPSGRIMRSCGHAGVDIPIAEEGCQETHMGLTWCRCKERACNRYPNMTETALKTSTTNASTAMTLSFTRAIEEGEFNESLPLYRQDAHSEGETEAATTLLNSSDFLRTELLENTTRNFSSVEARSKIFFDGNATSRSADTTTAGGISSTMTLAIETDEEPLFCFVCNDCGRSTGEQVECTVSSESRHCTLIQKPTGEVSRACGIEATELFLPGCNTTFGWTFCKCSGAGCNRYPDIIGDETTLAPAILEIESTTDGSLFFCRLCFDCGESTGISFPCAGVSSCSLTISQNRIARDCGSARIDRIIPDEDACIAMDNFDVVCKCSTENCNEYPELTASG